MATAKERLSCDVHGEANLRDKVLVLKLQLNMHFLVDSNVIHL
jgi:hypothetical protein